MVEKITYLSPNIWIEQHDKRHRLAPCHACSNFATRFTSRDQERAIGTRAPKRDFPLPPGTSKNTIKNIAPTSMIKART